MENEFIHSVIYQPKSDGGFNISVPIPTSYMYRQAFEMCLAKIQMYSKCKIYMDFEGLVQKNTKYFNNGYVDYMLKSYF